MSGSSDSSVIIPVLKILYLNYHFTQLNIIMDYYLLTLRLIHISAGVFWAGGIFMLALFILPAVKAAGPDGGKMMQQISNTNKFPIIMTIAATLNVLTGLLIYYDISSGFTASFFSSKHGMILAIGGLTALIAYTIGLVVNRPAAMRMATIGAAIAKQGAPPTPEQAAELGALKGRLTSGTNYIATLLVITVLAMAAARYMY